MWLQTGKPFGQQIDVPCPGIVAGSRIFCARVGEADNQFNRHDSIPNGFQIWRVVYCLARRLTKFCGYPGEIRIITHLNN